MKQLLVHTSLSEEDLSRILAEGQIGKDSKPLCSQIPLFKSYPLVFCSCFCQGYKSIYGNPNRNGIVFETESNPVYVSPIETFEFMRGGNWLPGYEKFIFQSMDEMLKKYPNSLDFKREFQEFFRSLNPKEVYPRNSIDFAESSHRLDYCLEKSFLERISCNEVAFTKPLKIKNSRIFNSIQEIENLLKN